MTFTHDDIENRLIEFLYGELEGEARAAFDAHLAGCERCRADVAAFQRTREVARSAVRAGLDEPVPAGVRARVLAAATAAAQGSSPAATNGQAASARAAAEAVKKTVKNQASGPFAWLRARWAVPMFVTVAAMGALLLTRETIFREARKPLGEVRGPEAPATGAGAPAPVLPGAPAAVPPAQSEAKVEVEVEVEKKRRRAEPAAATRRGGQLGGSLSDAMSNDGSGTGGLSRPRPAKVAKGGKAKAAVAAGSGARAAKADASDDILGGMGPAPRAAEPRDQLLDTLVDKTQGGSFAQPPPPRASAPASPPPSPSVVSRAAPAGRAVMGLDADTEDESPRSEKKAKVRSRKAEVEEESVVEGARVAEAPMASSGRPEEDAPRADPAAPLAARAERLMASRQWAEAVAAYRQLIARFPKHEQVPNWKRRLSVVEAAAARAAPPPSK